MKRKLVIAVSAVALIAGASLWMLSNWSVSALDEPGSLETYAATSIKRWQVAKAARSVAAAPPKDESAVAMGGMQFRAGCAACHGSDGRTPTDIGKWMSPRAPDLASPEIQRWSDAELFWIIKHGIKMSGMPGFGRIHSDERIWQMVYYVRAVAEQARP